MQGWSLETLRKYLYWAKASFQPTLSPAAEALLTGFYQAQRRLSDRSKALTTIRMLEGLIRIAQVRWLRLKNGPKYTFPLLCLE